MLISRFKNVLILVIIVLQALFYQVYAIEEQSVVVDKKNEEQATKKTIKKEKVKKQSKKNKKDVSLEKSETNETKLVGKIDFNQVLEKAQEHAYDLKIADLQILIAKQGIKGARSDYFPKLNFTIGTEYTKNLRNERDATVMTIGDAYINPYTRFQSVMGVTLTYNIFDFGVRGGNLKIAKEDVVIKEWNEKEKRQNINLNVIDTYAKVLMLKNQMELYSKIEQLEGKNLEYKTRLLNAKEISQTEYDDAIVKHARAQKKIFEIKSSLQESLNMLSFYTGETYNIDTLKVEDLGKTNFDINSFQDYSKTLVWKMHEHNIKKKELELQVAKHMNYPKINAYSKYYMYGSDYSNYPESIGNIRPSNVSVGISINTMLFDGMKNRANIGKVKLELQQLQVERDKAMAEYTTKLATMRSNLIYLNEQIKENEKALKALDNKEKSVHRLVAKKLVSPIEENDVKVQVLEQQIESEKNKITAEAITKGIQVLTKEY